MTREEAIEILEKQFDKSCRNYHYQNREKLDFEDALWMAISALRQQDVTDTDVGKNKPLTLDELRKMDGEPVWVEHYNGGEWVVVHWNIYGRITTAYNAELRYDEYGERWTAYRQKQEV